MYRNNEVHAGDSVMQKVAANNEWCAEAYMETDYSVLNPRLYERTARQFLMFLLMNDVSLDSEGSEATE